MLQRLPRSRDSWKSGRYETSLKREICALPPGALPLERATMQGGMVDDSDIAVSVLTSREASDVIETKVVVFFSEIVGGCNCNDDPVSANLQCTMLVSIDKHNADARFSLLEES